MGSVEKSLAHLEPYSIGIFNMAHKRMFSMDIVSSDAFIDMPSSSQLLYFHLGMRADDDGFIGNPKSVQRSVGSSDDDLKVLLTKRFILRCEDGVIVIKHWLINNTIRKDRYTPTKYLEQKSRLFLKKNKSYSDNKDSGIPNGNQLATQYRIGEDRIDIASQGKNTTTKGKELTKEEQLRRIAEIKESTRRLSSSKKI